MTDTVLKGSLSDEDSLRGGSKDIIDEIIKPQSSIVMSTKQGSHHRTQLGFK